MMRRFHVRAAVALAFGLAMLGCSSDAGHGMTDRTAGGEASSSDATDHGMSETTVAVPSVGLPSAESAEAGFAYDMSRHHAQAVEMAESVAGRTTDPDVGLLARDIALTQQYQIGEMRGWLDAWGLPATSLTEPMAWMEMPTAVPMGMPGMATAEEMEALRTAPAEDVDRMFLQMMITHHEGGFAMATMAAMRATVPYVRELADGIATSQSAEVETMREMLDRLDAP